MDEKNRNLLIIVIVVLILAGAGFYIYKDQNKDQKRWYVSVQSEARGPYTVSQLKKMYIETTTMVVLEGTQEWKEARFFREIPINSRPIKRFVTSPQVVGPPPTPRQKPVQAQPQPSEPPKESPPPAPAKEKPKGQKVKDNVAKRYVNTYGGGPLGK